jgi:hypothetical protein
MTVSSFDISSGRYPISGSFAIFFDHLRSGIASDGQGTLSTAGQVEESLMGFATVFVSTEQGLSEPAIYKLEK